MKKNARINKIYKKRIVSGRGAYEGMDEENGKSMAYLRIGATLHPVFILQNSLWSCEDIPYPELTGNLFDQHYIEAVNDFLMFIRKNSSLCKDSLWSTVSEYDREQNAAWNSYKQGMDPFHNTLKIFVRREIKNKYIIGIVDGPYLVNNINKVKKQAKVAWQVFDTKYRKIITEKIDSLCTSVSRQTEKLEGKREQLVRSYSSPDEFKIFKKEVDALYTAQEQALEKLTDIQKNSWLKPFLIAGALGFSAAVAVATFGVGTAALPFISGIIIVAGNAIYDGVSGWIETKNALCSTFDKFNKLLKSDNAKQFALFLVLNSYCKVSRMIINGLESTKTAIRLFSSECEKNFNDIIKWLSLMEGCFAKRKRLSTDDVKMIKEISASISKNWNFHVVRRYFEFSRTESNKLYCYKQEERKTLEEVVKLCSEKGLCNV